jgi:hypothetical protein
MHHEIEVVENDPATFRVTAFPVGTDALLLQSNLHFLGQGLEVRRAGTGDDQEIIGD